MAQIEFRELVKKNKFGFTTYQIILDTLHQIDLIETNNQTYIVEFKELGILWPTTIYSFTSNEHPFYILSTAMDKVADYFKNSGKYIVNENLQRQTKQNVLEQARYYFNK